MVGAASVASTSFFFQHRFDYAYHVGAAGEMLGFMKRSVGLAGDLAEMNEVNAGAEFASHREEIVVGSGSVGTDAKCETVCWRITARKNGAYIVGGRDDARQSE